MGLSSVVWHCCELGFECLAPFKLKGEKNAQSLSARRPVALFIANPKQTLITRFLKGPGMLREFTLTWPWRVKFTRTGCQVTEPKVHFLPESSALSARNQKCPFQMNAIPMIPRLISDRNTNDLVWVLDSFLFLHGFGGWGGNFTIPAAIHLQYEGKTK